MLDLKMDRDSKANKKRHQFHKIHIGYVFAGPRGDFPGDNLVFQDVTGLHIPIKKLCVYFALRKNNAPL